MIRLVLRIGLFLWYFDHFDVEDLPNTLCVSP